MKRIRRLLVASIVLALVLLLVPEAHSQDFVEYNVQINADGSAAWRIIQVSDIGAPIDSWTDYQQKLLNLVDLAANTTHREIDLDFDSLQIDTVISSE